MSATGKGIVFALFAGFVYGLAPPFTRLAFINGVPAIETAFWRVSSLVVIVGLIAVAMRWRIRVPEGAGGLLVLMAVSTGAISIGYLGAVQFIPVALAVIIFFTFPILILILSPLIEGPRRRAGLQMAVSERSRLPVCLSRWGRTRAAPTGAGSALRCWLLAVQRPCSSFTGRALSTRMSPLHFGLLAHVAIVPLVAVC
jgi:uncharacterized membrane protein